MDTTKPNGTMDQEAKEPKSKERDVRGLSIPKEAFLLFELLDLLIVG